MVEHVVTFENVTKSYGEFGLGPVSMEIEPGYMVAVVGPNGSGKSTLMRLLMNLVHPDEGDIRLFGERHGNRVAVTSRIGYVPERSTGHDQMSADDLGAFYDRWYPAFDRERYDATIAAMEIERGKAFGTLSKGIQRRVAFALAIAAEPDLLVLDELTDGVDPFARREMLRDITSFMESGDRTVLFSTHNMDEVRRLADYVIFLVGGQFYGMFEKDALLDDWRRLWLDREPAPDTPGVVWCGSSRPMEIVSGRWRETAAALTRQGIVVERTVPLELAEILEYLMAQRRTVVGTNEHLLARAT